MARPVHEHRIESRVPGGPDVYEFRAADGVLSGEELRTAELLSANAVDPEGGSVLVVDANYGVVPVLLAAEAGPVVAVERSARAVDLCRANAARNGAEVRVELLADPGDLPREAVPGATPGGEDDREDPAGDREDPTGDRGGAGGGAGAPAAGFDHVVYAPRPYDPAELVGTRLDAALALARPGGAVTVAAARGQGARRYRDRLRASVGAGVVERVDRGDGHDVYRATRPRSGPPVGADGPDAGADGPPAGTDGPDDGADRPDPGADAPDAGSPAVDAPGPVPTDTVEATVGSTTVDCVTRPGLFSPGRLDRGTELLARWCLGVDGGAGGPGDDPDGGDVDPDDEADGPGDDPAGEDALPVGPGDRVLDLCCGYGALGAVVAAATGASVVLTDDDRAATACAERTVERNGLGGRATVVTADCLDGVEGPFDAVVSNPPTHAGAGVTRELFAGAADILRSGGEFRLVYSETMGYEDGPLARAFRSVSVRHRAEGYALAVARP